MGATIGIDVGGTSIKAARVAFDGTVEEQVSVRTPAAPDEVAEAVRALAAKLRSADVQAAGAVVPGALDHASGVVRYSANLSWRDVPLRSLLAAELGVPVLLDNDVTAAAVAESEHRDGDLLYVALGTGIGGALVHDGQPLRGANGLAGEIGHLPVYPDGEPCACGQRGCLEVYASASGLARRYATAASGAASGAGPGAGPGTGPGTWPGEGPQVSAVDVAARAAHDPIAARVWHDATTALGLALASAVLLLDPARVVLGGGVAQAGDALLAPVRTELIARLTWRDAPELAGSALGVDAGTLGAALLARRLIHPTPDRKAGYPR